ncbi:hypothetical protein C3Y94_033575 (plasmid) [Rhizobium ruizarguesonis]|uniref:hypothetical protein n=1 Tax=Rhizobium ruizarguesonis TaxID=2081791 RepID=UPI00163A5210|nr:hypothetical protein [Rhizobium ruizarguesonis]MBC2808055.1 hypothetical protein [Rhizobium ruizarguesonis]
MTINLSDHLKYSSELNSKAAFAFRATLTLVGFWTTLYGVSQKYDFVDFSDAKLVWVGMFLFYALLSSFLANYEDQHIRPEVEALLAGDETNAAKITELFEIDRAKRQKHYDRAMVSLLAVLFLALLVPIQAADDLIGILRACWKSIATPTGGLSILFVSIIIWITFFRSRKSA